MENEQNKTDKNPSYSMMLAKVYFFYLLTFVIVFVLAGKITYWQGWAFCGIYLLFIVIVSIKFADRKDFLAERLKPGPGVKWWDKIFSRSYFFLTLCLLTVSVLDGGRFQWSPRLPAIIYAISYVLIFSSFLFVLWAMWTNNFFSSRVRIQTDKGQYVIQEGPYRFVRHPGYLGGIFWLITMPLVLGSL
ncbi:MAG: isoprenylcysteine carboxylmethyltransferase family protein [Sedimentisphaerales bacterium]